MSAQVEQTMTNPAVEAVLPRTLGIRTLRASTNVEGTTMEVTGVYGGRTGNVWVASFFDKDEAQAWILASNHFGQPVRGLVMPDLPTIEVTDGTRIPSRNAPEESN